jgi:hypothetical protein
MGPLGSPTRTEIGDLGFESRQQRLENGTRGSNAMAGRRAQQLEHSRKRIPGRYRKRLLMYALAEPTDSLAGIHTIKSAVINPATMAWYNYQYGVWLRDDSYHLSILAFPVRTKDICDMMSCATKFQVSDGGDFFRLGPCNRYTMDARGSS